MSTTRSTRSGVEAARRRNDAGAGVIAALSGVTVFLVLLLFAVQIAFDLYATSTVGAVAYDAARVVAGSDAQHAPDAAARAEADARRALGRYAAHARFDWRVDGDVVELHVVARNPSVVPAMVRRPMRLDVAERTVRVRVERVR